MKPTLYLIPVVLAEETAFVIPEYVKAAVAELSIFLVENERTARRYLRKIGFTRNFDTEVTLHVVDKRTTGKDVIDIFNQIPQGTDIGLMSEAGCPGIADPGAQAVTKAHQQGYAVKPLVGPSSILLALMASGFSGQQFAFHGYLPIERPDRGKAIAQLEKYSRRFRRTEIFMEAPYRNNKLLEDLVNMLHPLTKLCVACDLTSPNEWIFSAPVSVWKKTERPDLHKRPAIFLIYCN